MKPSSGCPQCTMRHALYVKAHRQLQAAGRKIIDLETKVRELESRKNTEDGDAG